MEYKAYISHDWAFNQVKIFVTSSRGESSRSYLTYMDGKAVDNIIEDCMIPDNAEFLILPQEVYKAIEEHIIKRVEERGGIETAQKAAGRIEEMEKQITWLQKLIEHDFKGPL